MLRRNNARLLILFLLTALLRNTTQAQEGAPNQPAPNQPPAVPAATSPAATAPPTGSSPSSSSASPPGQATPPNAAQNAETPEDSSVFVFRKQVEEVVLHATVVDDKQHIVTSLGKDDFNVYEDGHPQTITSFRGRQFRIDAREA
jgi:hypothetical protein